MSDAQEATSGQAVPDDKVISFLMSFHLAEMEQTFRGTLQNLSESPYNPTSSEMAVAGCATLMSMGGIPWPVILFTMSELRKLSPEVISNSAVAIVNGDVLLIPRDDGSVAAVHMGTMREVDEAPPALVSTVYSLSPLWDRAEEL